LASLVPVDLAAKRSKVVAEGKKFNEEVEKKTDAGLAKEADNEARPFAAILREALEKPEADPVGMEMLKNGIAMTLLLRAKLTENGYLKPISEYVPFSQTSDQLLHELAGKL